MISKEELFMLMKSKRKSIRKLNFKDTLLSDEIISGKISSYDDVDKFGIYVGDSTGSVVLMPLITDKISRITIPYITREDILKFKKEIRSNKLNKVSNNTKQPKSIKSIFSLLFKNDK